MSFWNRKKKFLEAADTGNLVRLKECISKGVDKGAKNKYGYSALHLASGNGHLEIVQYLIETCHVDKEAKDKRGSTALHVTSYHGQLNIVKYLVEICHVNTEAKDNSGWTALHRASKHGHLEIVKYLVAKCHFDKEASDDDGRSAYDIALANNKREVAQYLLKMRLTSTSATPQQPREKEQASKQPAPTVQEFLEATKEGNLDKVRYCASNGIAKEAKDNDEWTALHFASWKGHLEIVKYLTETCHVDTEAKNNLGSTALHFASRNGHLEIVKYLIETCQVDKEAKINEGWTALHCSTYEGHLEIVKYLIEECYVDKDAKTNNGQSPYDIAITYNKSEIGHYMQKMSEDVAEVNGSINMSPVPLEEETNDRNDDSVVSISSEDQPQSSTANIGTSNTSPLVITSVSCKLSEPAFDLNEACILSLQDENQLIVDRLSQLDSSIQFIDERRDLLDLIAVEKCMTIEEQNEQRAILASPKHRDFYLLLQRKLKCMIKSCETLSTAMVSVAGGDMRAFCARTISENGYSIFKETKVGFFIANAVKWSKKNLACIPFVDTVGSVFQVIVALKNERDRYMGLASVADFATMACLPHYGATSLDVTIEKVARYFVRARVGTMSCKFVEKKDQFGKLKQFMINLLAVSGNTPAKEEASKAADCTFAHIMKPSEDSVLLDVLNDSILDVGLAEALTATTLGIEIEELRNLEAFSTESQLPFENKPSVLAVKDGPRVVQFVLRREHSSDASQLGDINVELDELQSQFCKMNREIEFIKKKINDSKSKNSSAGGLTFVDEYEDNTDGIQFLISNVNYLLEEQRTTDCRMTNCAERIADLDNDINRIMKLIRQQMNRRQKAQFLRQQEEKKKKWENEKEEQLQTRIAGDDDRINKFKMGSEGVWSRSKDEKF